MRPIAMGIALACAASADAQSTQPSHILYEFDIRVVSNQFIPLGSGGDLLNLTVGSIGSLSMLVNTDPDRFPDANEPGITRAFAIEEIAFDVNSVTAGGAPGLYPSVSFFNGLFIQNDGPATSGRVLDQLTSIFAFDNPSFGLTVMTLGDIEPAGSIPALLDSIDLPTSLDLSLLDGVDMVISNPSGGPERVVFEFFDVTITPIPAPASAAALVLAALTCARRRS